MPRWSIPVPVLPDESISSWLTRAALNQGCDPLTLTGAVWPKWRVWTVDPDRGLPPERSDSISKVSGVPVCDLQAAALRPAAERIAGRRLPARIIWPWVLALGTQNRSRRCGQQFCPICLAEGPQAYFRRSWRFAWHTSCDAHHVELFQRCCSCGAIVVPHALMAEDRHLTVCSNCKHYLSLCDPRPADSRALTFQRSADSALVTGVARIGDAIRPAHEWFALARLYVSLLRIGGRSRNSRLANALRALNVNLGEALPLSTGLSLELLATNERVELLGQTSLLLDRSPEAVGIALSKAGVGYTAICYDDHKLPDSAKGLVIGLPRVGVTRRARMRAPRSRSPKSRRQVLASWARLKRKMPSRPS